jgi:hypothetical protein
MVLRSVTVYPSATRKLLRGLSTLAGTVVHMLVLGKVGGVPIELPVEPEPEPEEDTVPEAPELDAPGMELPTPRSRRRGRWRWCRSPRFRR